ncbi:MAG TPA: tetratricopeptide repeat protein [Bryobacteraceae bacterium]|nr:tetratricopeptide repeat protein [Bryobacteraceae bacterium]
MNPRTAGAPRNKHLRAAAGLPWQTIALACSIAFIALFGVYGPALHGPFVFDDLSLPFSKITRDAPLFEWMSGVRPVLMFSYWVNYHFWGIAPFSYHVANLLIHFVNSSLVFLVLLRLLRWAAWPQRRAAAASIIGALIFAFHPLQTESVSYVAGRSESLASLFVLLAYAVFLYRRNPSICWGEALITLTLFGIAVKTKENAVSLAGILVLTDLFFPVPFSFQGLKRNWKLYCVMAPGVLVAGFGVLRVLASAQTAGFSLVTYKWYQYAFTEARALFSYVGLTIFPLGQSIDQDYPPSHTILDHGAIVYMVLLAGLLVFSILRRRQYPLFCFGLLMFLIWLAPTSSVIPLDDALVERRMYLPLVGLILIGFEIACRIRVSRGTCACILAFASLALGKLCYDRNQLWGQPDKLLELAASTAAYNPRPLLNFTEVLIRQGRCELGPAYLERAERQLPNNYYVNAAWGRTLACLGHFDQALERLQTAIRINPCSRVYESIGLVYGQMGRLEDAGSALKMAVKLDPNSETAHGSLAMWFEKTDDLQDAENEYRTAISLDRMDSWAKTGLIRVRAIEGERKSY